MKTHYDVVLHRYSFVGDPSKPNFDGNNEFLFGSLKDFDMNNREDRKFLSDLRLNKDVRFYIVHVKECNQLLDNGCSTFLPKDVIGFVEV